MELAIQIVLELLTIAASILIGVFLTKIYMRKRNLLVSMSWDAVRNGLRAQGVDPDDFEMFLHALLLTTAERLRKKGESAFSEGTLMNVNETTKEIVEMMNMWEEYAKENNIPNWKPAIAAFVFLETQAQQASKEYKKFRTGLRFGFDSRK